MNDPVFWLAVVVHVLAVVDAGFSRMSGSARVLWGVLILGMPVVGLMAWMLTRHTAHQPVA